MYHDMLRRQQMEAERRRRRKEQSRETRRRKARRPAPELVLIDPVTPYDPTILLVRALANVAFGAVAGFFIPSVPGVLIGGAFVVVGLRYAWSWREARSYEETQ